MARQMVIEGNSDFLEAVDRHSTISSITFEVKSTCARILENAHRLQELMVNYLDGTARYYPEKKKSEILRLDTLAVAGGFHLRYVMEYMRMRLLRDYPIFYNFNGD
ncbi:hypothetical protein LOAG_07356 [Loa loa]|uniref:Uncharacterized protein n=1 Tax=Loa loa TaxID=7209 RepID=A0A1S0TWQ4_LOALO|nr:hypothetical protein LOAG_07356 [Loa loa]EFO21134.1 hypothetical protein LOAG_07356 [Loa loa]